MCPQQVREKLLANPGRFTLVIIGCYSKLLCLQDGEGHVMMSDGIPVTDSSLDGSGVGGVLSSSPLMVPETITGDTISSDPIGEYRNINYSFIF